MHTQAIEPRASDIAGPLVVLLSGLTTTALTLLGVFWLARNTDDFNIMGWYANYVVPAGAIMVGIAASSGYGVASWVKGVKISGLLLAAVLTFQVAAYFAAHYTEFRQLGLKFEDGTPVDFISYFDWATRSFAWQEKNGKSGEPLGLWGYGLRALEVIGFSLGSLIVPLALRKHPYCESCSVYMRKKTLGWLPASVPHRKVKKKDEQGQAAYAQEQEKALDAGRAVVVSLGEMAKDGVAASFQARIAESSIPARQAGKLPVRMAVRLTSCPRCDSGEVLVNVVTGQGQHIREELLHRERVEPYFVRDLRAAPRIVRAG